MNIWWFLIFFFFFNELIYVFFLIENRPPSRNHIYIFHKIIKQINHIQDCLAIMEISKIISLSTACSSGHAFRVLQENKQPAESYIGDGGAEAQFGSLHFGRILLWNLLQQMPKDPLLTLMEPSMQAVRQFWKQPKKQQCCVGHFGRCNTNIRDKEPNL